MTIKSNCTIYNIYIISYTFDWATIINPIGLARYTYKIENTYDPTDKFEVFKLHISVTDTYIVWRINVCAYNCES